MIEARLFKPELWHLCYQLLKLSLLEHVVIAVSQTKYSFKALTPQLESNTEWERGYAPNELSLRTASGRFDDSTGGLKGCRFNR